jgi:hypothetical protein
MPYCEDCKKYKKGKHNTGFGKYVGTCKKYEIGVNPETDSCEYIDPIELDLYNRGKMPDKVESGGIKESEFFE